MILGSIDFTRAIHVFFEEAHSEYIKIVDTPCSFGELPDVEEDKFMVIVGIHAAVGTYGLGTCFAVCAGGQTLENIPVIALAHKTSCVAIRDVFHALKKEMVRLGCVKSTIKTVVIGGESPSIDEPGCVEDQNEFLMRATKQKTREMLFNFARGEEESLSVVVTPEKIYVSKEYLYETLDGADFMGINLLSEDDEMSIEDFLA